MNPVIERVFDAIIRIDLNLNIKFVSDTGLRWLGGTIPTITASFIDLIVEDDHKIIQNIIKDKPEHFSCYVRILKNDDSNVLCTLRATYMPVVNQYLICILDIADYEPSNIELIYAAEHDFLTQIPNRSKLTTVINEHIQSGKISFCVALIDLDGFKRVNDTLGHLIGDEVLVETSKRLIKAIDLKRDVAARLGGDEFVLVLDDATDKARIDAIMYKVLNSIARPFYNAPHDAYLGCSIGLSNYPEHGETYTELLRNADAAMYLSKHNGKNCVSSYTQTLDSVNFSIKSAIHNGIQEGEFYLEYQPQYDINKRLLGAEALMRWKSSILGTVVPEQFISIAEETGLMPYLGEWALRYACYQLKEFQKHAPNFVISVNVSPIQFSNEDFYSTVTDVIEETGINPANLILEITESTLMKSQEKIELILSRLRKEGIRFAIDDFGTGFSSLSYLTRLPVSTLKIDKSFVKAIENQSIDDLSKEKKLIKAMVQLAHSIELRCVAEGLETEEQFDFLKSIGCNYLQGFYLSKPISSSSIIKLLQGVSEDAEQAS